MAIGALVLAALALVAGPNARVDRSPVWSPDGKQLAFVRDGGSSPGLYVVRVGAGGARRIARRVAPYTRPSWSPNGRWLVYARVGPHAPPVLPDVVVVRSDGTGAGRIGAGQTPLWSPRGGAIAYVGYDGLDVVRPDGRGKRRLVVPAPHGLWGWSADAALLAFPGKGVDVVPASGGPARLIALEGQNAAWSPRDHRVAYDNFCGISVWTVTGDPNHYDASLALPCLPVSIDGPASWSPDASKIVFSFCFALNGCRIETAAPARIGPGQAPALACGYGPSWSPAGSEIAFTSSGPAPARTRTNRCRDSGSAGLYVMRPDGTHIRRLD
jgi:WD40 repeat protein